MSTAEYPVWLAVLPDQRDAARADAGKHPDGRSAIAWSKEEQLWYARPGADLSRLQAWLPDRSIRNSGGGDPQAEFLDALNSAGLVLNGMPVMDGQRHRVATLEDKSGSKSGVYRGFLDGRPGGWYINYHRAENDKAVTNWKASGGEFDPSARIHIRAGMRQSQDNFAREQATLYARQTAKALALYARLPAADPLHPYLVRKGITPTPELRQTRNGALVVPFFDVSNTFRTLQYIPPEGEKYLFKDAPKHGHFLPVGGDLRDGEPILYAEGYATARSLNMATGRPVVMTIDAGNIANVASALKAQYPRSSHFFMADVDHTKKVNKGTLSAEHAARLTNGTTFLPPFTPDELSRGLTDFNDIHQSRGLLGLREALNLQPGLVLTLSEHKDPHMSNLSDTGNTSQPDEPAQKKQPRSRSGSAQEKASEILRLSAQGMTGPQIAAELNIGASSVYRILKAQQPETTSAAQSEPGATDVQVARVNDLPAASPATEQETITLYHGSPAAFSAIDSEKIGLGQNLVGRGFYTDTSVTGVHYVMEEINNPDYYIYELKIPSNSIILDRWDSSSLTDGMRERIREAGKTVHQQFTEKGDSSGAELGNRLADSAKIDDAFFNLASSTQGMSILKEAGVTALKDNSYIAIVNTDLIDNIRLRSSGGGIRKEMSEYIDNALGDVVKDSSRLSNILQGKPNLSEHYNSIRSEIIKLAKDNNKPEEADRLTSLLTHTLVETIDSGSDRKSNITPLNRLYAEAIRSLDLNHSDSAARLGHLIDFAVVNINPKQKPVTEPDKPVPAATEPVPIVQDIPVPEASQRAPGAAGDATPVPEPFVPAPAVAEQTDAAALPESAPSLNVPDVQPSEAPLAPDAGAEQPSSAPATATTTESVDFSKEFADINNSLRALKDEAAGLDTDTMSIRLGKLINERIELTAMWSQGNDTENARWPSDESEVLEAELRAVLDQRTDTSPSPLAAASGEENAILVGAPRVEAQDEDTPASSGPASSRIDADKLLSRITHEEHRDGKSVLYKLDGEPAFIDRGTRLVMAEGASAHEEKVLAALLTAANHYHGRIELTGSDEFKAFAIGVIVANKLDVSMKNAIQQADLDAARRAAGQPVTPAAPADAVRGDPDVRPTNEAPPVTPHAQTEAPVQNAAPVTPSLQPVPSEPVAPRTSAAVHTPAEKAREPVTGKVTACGQAPFRFEPDASESTYITLRNKEGMQTFWGKELAGLLRETNLKPGRMVTLQWMGEQPVSIKVPEKDINGVVTHYKNKDTRRNKWSLTPVGGSRVQTGGDELVQLSAFDVSRYKQVQHAVVSRLGLDMPPPPKPADGLYWIKPDGQGSTTSGDPLSASRPAQNDRAGTPVMSSWGKDGSPDLYLVQGDGNYLQGVVRQNGGYQHVLVSLPDSKEAPPMVVNVLTPEGAQPIGSGNGINRSNGQAIPREHVVIRLTGDAKPRIAKLDIPAEIPPALHARLGYDERYKAESGWVKEQPAAAPQAAPATPPRPAQ